MNAALLAVVVGELASEKPTLGSFKSDHRSNIAPIIVAAPRPPRKHMANHSNQGMSTILMDSSSEIYAGMLKITHVQGFPNNTKQFTCELHHILSTILKTIYGTAVTVNITRLIMHTT